MTGALAAVVRKRQRPLVRAIRASAPDPARTVLAVVAGTGALGAAIGLMATSAWLISRAAQQPLVGVLAVAVVAVRALGISRGVLRYIERLVSHDVALRGVTVLRERIYRRLAAADPATVAGLRSGDLLARVGADVDALADLIVRSLLPFAVAALTCLASGVLVAAVLPAAGLVVGLGLLVAGAGASWLAAIGARRAEQDAAAARSLMSEEVLALVDGLGELTVAGVSQERLHRLVRLDTRLTSKLDAAARPAALAAAVSSLATALGALVALVIAVQAVQSSALSQVMLAVVALTPLAAAEAVAVLPGAAIGLVRSRTAAVRVLELLGPDSVDIVAGREGEDPAVPRPVPPRMLRPRLRATGLACGWPGRDPAVRGLDLDLAPGRGVALVGASGCGKTTVLLTLAGLLEPAAGRLSLSGEGMEMRELCEVGPDQVRRTVSFTAEDAHVFTTTVRENLRVADPGRTDEDLTAALRRAGLGRWLADLPFGLDTMLSSGPGAAGARLSGGERRRLLLARALLVGAGVLLLDEPTEHLDPTTADALLRDILTPGGADSPAVVVVTHRLSGLGAADEVVLLADGELAARGTHGDLLERDVTYREAWLAEQPGTPQSRGVTLSRDQGHTP